MLSGRTTIYAAICTWWAYTQEAPNEILIIANDLEQAQARTFKAIRGFLCYNPALTHSADPQSLRATRRSSRLPSSICIGDGDESHSFLSSPNHKSRTRDEI